jgi:hypothetical protein
VADFIAVASGLTKVGPDCAVMLAIEVGIESGEDVALLTTQQKNSIRQALGQHPLTLIALRTQLARDSF